MRKACRILLLWLLDILGINALCRLYNRNKAIILFYHGICDEEFNLLKGYSERHIPISSFRKQLEYLKRHGYIFISMTELLASLKSRTRIKKYVVLTFDDGFRNIPENAYPIMQEFNAKGCIYLVSDLVGTKKLLWTDYVETVIRNQPQGNFEFVFKGEKIKYTLKNKTHAEYAMRDIKAKLRSIPDTERVEHLNQFNNYNLNNIPDNFLMANWEQIKELDPEILEIGSHTRSHPNCENLISDEELEREILDSKIEIEDKTGRRVIHFCYPAGSYNDTVVKKVMEYGYESAVTITHGFIDQNADRYKLKRIPPGNNYLLFKSRISGSNRAISKFLTKSGISSAGNS